jgi:hypothetical protein
LTLGPIGTHVHVARTKLKLNFARSLYLCYVISYHRDVARPQVADGGDGFHIRRVAAIYLISSRRQPKRSVPQLGGLEGDVVKTVMKLRVP